MASKKNDSLSYPVHLLGYPAQLVLDSTIASIIITDEYVFSTLFAALFQGLSLDGVDAEVLIKLVEKDIPGVKFDDIDPALIDHKKQEEMVKVVDSLRAQFNEQITTTYVKDFLIATTIYRNIVTRKRDKDAVGVMQNIVKGLISHYGSRSIHVKSSITANLERLQDILGMTIQETRLMEMAFLFSTDVRCIIFRDFFFTMIKNASMYDHCYRIMLGEREGSKDEPNEIGEALTGASKPIALGIVSYDQKLKRLSRMTDYWTLMISTYVPADSKYFERFVAPIAERKKTFSGAIAKVQSDKDAVIFQEFVHKVTDQWRVPEDNDDGLGRNVLIYGSKRLDKLGYVAGELEKLNVKAFQVRTKDARASDIPAICFVAQQWIKRTEDHSVVLVIDKAEQALSREYFRPAWMMDFFDDSLDKPDKKEELDSDELLLIKNPIPTIWLTNSPGQISPENVGRFLFHLQLKGGSRKDRRDEIERIVKELGFSDTIVQKLSMYLELNVEQIKSAARMIHLRELKFTPDEARKKAEAEGGVPLSNELVEAIIKAEESLLHMVENSQRALDREKTEKLRDTVTKYSLDLLNISGNMDIERIIKALKRKPEGTICLYGLPGTGKTALAEYIAMQLDMPLLLKPASELLNMYLGETEKKIAEAFEEAKQSGSIFLLDEADSFLRDRALSQRSWEVTQVNELLQQMERFPGIFICATNLFQQLDAAALRRFTFKLEFHELTEDQRMKMLANECNLNYDTMDKELFDHIEYEMLSTQFLTPGDFATVKRQANLLGEDLTVDEWIDRLKVEAKAKVAGLTRNSFGFMDKGDGRPKVPEVTPKLKPPGVTPEVTPKDKA